MAVDLMELHPEYHADLENPDAANQDFSVEQGKTNPFLHLSMHLAINEQLSIDQPPGIKAAFQSLLATRDAHEAAHIIMEALGEVVWEARSEEHTSELQSLMRISYADFCLKKKTSKIIAPN